MANAFAHPRNSDSRSLRLNFSKLFGGYSLAVIFDFKTDIFGRPREADSCRLAAGMAKYVGYTLLYDAKHRQFYLAWKTAE